MTIKNAPYFPPLYGDVECGKCDKENCDCRGKYQRNRRDFEVTSGRCPRLPDMHGFLDKNERKLFASVFSLIHAELGCDTLHLTLSTPTEKRDHKIYQTKSGYWYYKTKDNDGDQIRKIVIIGAYHNKEEIVNYMELLGADYCLLPCEITEYRV